MMPTLMKMILTPMMMTIFEDDIDNYNEDDIDNVDNDNEYLPYF